MFTRRIALAMLVAVLTSALFAAPVAAAKPTKPPKTPPAAPVELPLTPEEEAAAAAKLAAAEAYLADIAASGVDLASLNCVTPSAATATEPTAGEANDAAGAITIQGCYVPQGFLSVEARDQVKNIYCGPAVGQVIANYAWAMGPGANKYTQGVIAGWMATDANGGTGAHGVEAGLDRATAGAPRKPAQWDWVVIGIGDWDGDGQVGDSLHTVVRSNISNSRMPVAIPVKPHDPNSRYYLVSWPRAVVSIGHWIAAYGWVGLWSNNDYSRLYYTDSSRDEGGSTGKFWDPMRHIAALVMEHTQRVVW